MECLNADPGNGGARLPVIEPDGSIIFGTSKFPLFIEYPSDEDMVNVQKTLDVLGPGFDVKQLVRRVVTMGEPSSRHGSRHSSRPGTPYAGGSRSRGAPY